MPGNGERSVLAYQDPSLSDSCRYLSIVANFVAQIIEELDEALVYSDIVLALLPPSKNKDNLVKILDIVKTAVNAINDKNPDLGEAEKLVLIEKTVKASLEKLGHPEALNEELIIKTIQKVLSKSE